MQLMAEIEDLVPLQKSTSAGIRLPIRLSSQIPAKSLSYADSSHIAIYTYPYSLALACFEAAFRVLQY